MFISYICTRNMVLRAYHLIMITLMPYNVPLQASGTRSCLPGLSILLLWLIAIPCHGQHQGDTLAWRSRTSLAVRNNLLYDATLSPNLGLELRLDSTWTLGMNGGLNLWDIDKGKNKKWRHLMLSPYLRHYNKMMFERSFWGIHAVYSHYNVSGVKFPFGIYKSARDRRLQGDLLAIGGSYGHNWLLTGRLHLEAELGVAVGYAWYKEYDCATCGTYLGKHKKLILLPKLGLNLVWSTARKRVPLMAEQPLGHIEPEPPIVLAIHDVAVLTGQADSLEADTAAATINRACELLRTDCGDCHRYALTLLLQVKDDERAQNALGVALYLCGQKDEATARFLQAAQQGDADAQENLRQIEKRRNDEITK